MKQLTSCQESINRCIENRFYSIAHLYKEEKSMQMHIHNCHELYFSIYGGQSFLIGKEQYAIEPGDIFFINQFEGHYLQEYDTQTHERIVISVFPEFLEQISSSRTDLTYCFTHRPELFSHRLHLSIDEQKRFLYFINKISSIEGFGADLMEQSVFTELMLFLTRLHMQQSEHISEGDEEFKYHDDMDEIMLYIHQHFHERITLTSIAEHFYMSESKLRRLFRQHTGLTLSTYLSTRRVALAKSLLASGMSTGEVFTQCGFNDYSTFFRSFKKSVGLSPKKYALLCIK